MTTAEFLARLERHREGRLAFSAGDAHVAPGYHVTEIKATTIHAVDCGGRSTHWNETTFQLWSPEAASGAEYMGVQKFLAIYDRVGRLVPIDEHARVRVEYGAPGEPDRYRTLRAERRRERREPRACGGLLHLNATHRVAPSLAPTP
jgi:hypothetical protein